MTAMGEGMNFSSPHHTAGGILAEERQRQGLDLTEVSSRLRLSNWQVEALESDQYERLPGATFIRGIIRSYAKALNIDPQPALDAYGRVAPDGAQIAINVPSHNIRFDPSNASGSNVSFKIGAVVLTIGIVAGVFWLWYSGVGPRIKPVSSAPAAKTEAPTLSLDAPSTLQQPQVTVPPSTLPQQIPVRPAQPIEQAQQQPQQQAPQVPAPPVSAPATNVNAPSGNALSTAVSSATSLNIAKPVTAAVSPAPNLSQAQATPAAKPVVETAKPTLRLTFNGDSWVEVKDGTRKVIFKRLNHAGSEQILTGTPPFKLVVGNATAVHLFYNDKAIDMAPHTQVHVARLTVE